MSRELDDVGLADRLATEAGRLLLTVQRSGLLAGAALGDAGDRVANAFIMAALRAARPDDAIMCEEERDSAARLSARRVWIVDPLDGTREFSEGRDDWAVHVALATEGNATVGAVALPARSLTLTSSSASPLSTVSEQLRMVVSRTRPAAEAVLVAERLGAALLPMGSAGAKAMAVVLGEADIYLHSGGQHEWDNAAPVAVAHAAGLHCSRIDGAPLRYNNANTLLPDLLIARPEVAAQALHILREAQSG